VEVIGVAAGSEEAVAAEALGDLAAAPVEAAARPAVGKIRVICLLRGWGHCAGEDGMLAREEKLIEIVRRLQEAAGENLQSIVLYGSAARGDYHSHKSDLNLLCILKSAKASDLARIASVIRWWCEQLHEPVPRIFTQEELIHSADVFSIELLDIGQAHRVLFGDDPIAEIEVPMNLHRAQVEHELRVALQRLREHFLRNSENEHQLREIYGKSISSITVLLRHVLIALGEDAPSGKHEVYQRIEELTGAEAAVFELGRALRENHPLAEVTRAYGKYMEAIQFVIDALDALAPKREWQRVRR
jgi:predicted nucleotidyltransferase